MGYTNVNPKHQRDFEEFLPNWKKRWEDWLFPLKTKWWVVYVKWVVGVNGGCVRVSDNSVCFTYLDGMRGLVGFWGMKGFWVMIGYGEE